MPDMAAPIMKASYASADDASGGAGVSGKAIMCCCSSNHVHAPCRDGRGRNDVDVERNAPSFGQAHARRFVAGIGSRNDKTYEPVGHDLVALLNVNRKTADIGHEDPRTPRDICADIPGTAG